jgi:ATP-dependent exoDNAse (exonuclease V) beta subunit
MLSASTASSPLLDSLNPEQRAAVTLPPEHALILAGAGSGKTRVLTTRIAWLLQEGHISPGGILAVTFTNKAAKEMVTRLTAMLPISVRGRSETNSSLRGSCRALSMLQRSPAGPSFKSKTSDTLRAKFLPIVKKVFGALGK